MSLSPCWNYIGPTNAEATDTLGPWDYQEAYGSGATGIASGSNQTTRIFYVQWARWPNFIDDLLGHSALVAPGSGNCNAFTSSSSSARANFRSKCNLASSQQAYCLTRELPDVHPLNLAFFATDATVEGISGLGIIPNNSSSSSTASGTTCTYYPLILNGKFINYKVAKVTAATKHQTTTFWRTAK